MTGLPASIVGLAERGLLRPGMFADVTIFDPRTIADRATINQPTVPATGIGTVIVNGRIALDNGHFTPGAGRYLRRSRHEPSRAMAMNRGPFSLRATGAGQSVFVQISGNRQVLHYSGPMGRMRAKAPVTLQVAPGWAAITAMGQWADGTETAFSIFVEQGELIFAAAGRGTVRLAIQPNSLPKHYDNRRGRR
jgi:N-acyl-D-amino-acid deacylase